MHVPLAVLFLLLLPLRVDAERASLYAVQSAEGERRTSVVMFDPSSIPVNVIAGEFVLPPGAHNVKTDTSRSVVWVWITEPEAVDSTVRFEALLPGGFTGVALPGSGLAGAGELFAISYDASAHGAIESPYAFAHDGLGTPVPLTVTPSVSGIREERVMDAEPPTITFAEIIRDPLVREGAPTLVVYAIDRGMGMDRIELRSGEDAWHTIETGHALSEEQVVSGVTIRAFDRAGNYRELVLASPVREVPYALPLLGIVAALLFLVYFTQWRGSHSLR